MESSQGIQMLRSVFPSLSSQSLVERIANEGQWMQIPAETDILTVGAFIQVIPLVVQGNVKVFREDDQGNVLLLYYIKPGESCAITLASLYQRGTSSIKATTIAETTLLAVPSSLAYELQRESPAWQAFVVQTFHVRFDELLHLLDLIAFTKLDQRLEHYLQSKASLLQTDTLQISHQEIADDLATSREVISRLLKQMATAGIIETRRGSIRLVSPK